MVGRLIFYHISHSLCFYTFSINVYDAFRKETETNE